MFSKLTAAVVSAGGFLAANADGKAVDGNDFLVFETDTGKLFYDVDGNTNGASGVAKVQFAVIANYASIAGAALSAADFVVF